MRPTRNQVRTDKPSADGHPKVRCVTLNPEPVTLGFSG